MKKKKIRARKFACVIITESLSIIRNSRTVKAIWIRFVVVVKATKFYRIECYEFYSLSTVHWHFAWNTVTVVFVIFTISPTSIQCFVSQWNIFIWFIENKSFREDSLCKLYLLKLNYKRIEIYNAANPYILHDWPDLWPVIQPICPKRLWYTSSKSHLHIDYYLENLFRFLEESRW